MAGLNDVAREAGLNPATEKKKDGSEHRVNTSEALEEFFNIIIQKCAEGETVRIKNFGSFRMRTMKGRTVKSPLMEDGEISFPDTRMLKFHQSSLAKGMLNKLSPPEGAKAKAKPKASKTTKKAGKKAGKKKLKKRDE